jgi:hypothetical protein
MVFNRSSILKTYNSNRTSRGHTNGYYYYIPFLKIHLSSHLHSIYKTIKV